MKTTLLSLFVIAACSSACATGARGSSGGSSLSAPAAALAPEAAPSRESSRPVVAERRVFADPIAARPAFGCPPAPGRAE